MGSIVLLDELTINKIAAGEVVERPASVVKEMIENSIDAGAKHITVEIKNGGISFIRITDDGKGIQKDDVEMAFERHATSKIRSADDLTEVKSMGFRGEALASIAAIANVELVSKQETDEIGTRIVVEGGNVLSLDEIGCSKGTTITVRNLFYNTPVRYKFLKKDFTESGYIEDVVTRIALIHPEVAIKYINTGKVAISTNGSGNIRDAIYSIFGKEVANSLIDVDYEFEYIKINGVIGKPNICRSNRSNQIFYVNTRYVKDKTLSSAVEQAFKGVLPFGKFPFLVLNVEMNASKVDVNVHPAKLEVRFAEESLVFKAMYHAIKDALLKQDIIKENPAIDENQIKVSAFEQKKEEIREKVEDSTPKKQEIPESVKLSGEELINKLKLLQDELKKEVQENPNIQLTDEYKQMTEKYNSKIAYVSNNEIPQTDANLSENQDEKIENIAKNDEGIKEENKELSDVESNPKQTQDVISEENVEINLENNEKIIPVEENEETDLDDSLELLPNITFRGNILETPDDNSEKTLEIPLEDNIEQPEDVNQEDINESKLEEDNIESKLEENNNKPIIETDEINSIPEEQVETTVEQPIEDQNGENTEISFRQMYKKLFGKEPYGGRNVESTEDKKNIYSMNEDDFSQDNLSMFESEEQYNKPVYKLIGTAFESYIILEIQNELYVMDQKLANERIMSEKIKNIFYNEQNKSSQMLLLPDLIDLDVKQMNIAKDNKKLFEKAGFTLEDFGENTIRLSGVPEICVDLNTEDLFKEILEEINQAPRNDEEQKEKKFIDAIASKVAERMPIHSSQEDIENLIEALLSLQNPFVNSEGKPIAIKMNRYEIERKFARK